MAQQIQALGIGLEHPKLSQAGAGHREPQRGTQRVGDPAQHPMARQLLQQPRQQTPQATKQFD